MSNSNFYIFKLFVITENSFLVYYFHIVLLHFAVLICFSYAYTNRNQVDCFEMILSNDHGQYTNKNIICIKESNCKVY